MIFLLKRRTRRLAENEKENPAEAGFSMSARPDEKL